MVNHLDDVVIIGAGLAAASAAEALREEGYAGPLTVVGTEPEPPYERPQLSKDFLKGDSEFALVHDEAWYAEKSVTLRTGTTATAIDTAARTIALDDGSSLTYGALLLATGAQPRLPGLPGEETALVLRTIADARRLKESIKPGTRVALVGGGWIGLEAAAAVTALGGRAVVLEVAELPLQNVLGPTVARYLADLHVRHGVEIRSGVDVTGITADGVETCFGTVAADVVVVATGAAPDVALAKAAGLTVADEAPGGIVVDEHLRTSVPDVYAAGDVALATNTRLGPLRVEHWDNAIRQGKLAAASMLGKDAVYDWLPYFYTDQFEFSMEYVGRSAPDDEVVIRGDLKSDEFIAYWLRDGVITAGMNVGIWDVNDRLRELVGTKVDPDQLTDLR